jgi:tripartite-type tricarboxylate transporter receptor subunit TctC
MYSRGAVAIVIASVTWLAGPATAETYPTRTIRLIVPYAPGGATDVVGRRVGQRLSEVVGQSVVVENSEYGVRSIDELIRFAKTRRGALNYGAFSYPLEYFIEKLNKENGIDLVKVPFRSGTELANAMLANSTPIGGLGVSNIVSYLESGRMIGLAVNSYERMVLFPDIPTVNELRPGEKYPPAWFGLFAPAGTPREIVEKIADVKTFGPAGQKLDDFRKFIAEDRAIAQRIVKDLGVEPQ